MVSDFKSDDHLALAKDLSDMLIDAISHDPSYGGAQVAKRLGRARDRVWSKKPLSNDQDGLLKQTLEGLSPQEKTQFFEGYARLGHLYDIAALAARENYFEALRNNKIPIPGGITEFMDSHADKSIGELVEALNKPIFEVVMTMHPTNTNGSATMAAQRKVAQSIAAHDEGRVREAVGEFLHVPLFNQKNGQDANFTVRDEAGIVLHTLGNIYEDMPELYKKFDEELKKKQGYDPTALKLGVRFGSWGSSGDKDGNDSVTAETTLEAIALHTQAIISRYDGFLKKHDALLENSNLKSWSEKLSDSLTQLNPLVDNITSLREESESIRKEGTGTAEDGVKLNERFDALSQQLAKLRANLDAGKFVQDIETAYRDEATQDKQGALDLLRRARVFGFNFSKIEYRETAEEYTRVVAALVPSYEALSPAERVGKLTSLLSQEGAASQSYQAMQEKIIRQGAGKKYSKDNALPIAYHTIKRMELARDFPDMITDNVLAECGKIDKKNPTADEVRAQGGANMLEAVFLQHAAANAAGKRPILGVVPLFEQPETMQNNGAILQGVYRNPVYDRHLTEVAQMFHQGKKTQQEQIAHSDNARRAGAQAARAFIHEGHKNVRNVNDLAGIATQHFEGGSISDAYRNGVRAISASVNAFGMHDFAKFTFQGGDLLNYFNTPGSMERLFTRNIVHSADVLMRGHGKNGNSESYNPVLDEIAISALKRTLDDYQKKDFTHETMGTLLAALDYDTESKIGASGSRAGSRGLAFAKGDQSGVGAIHPVPIDKVRTISFSKAWQHAGIVPSWIGSQKLEQYMQEETVKRLDQLASHPELARSFATVKNHGLNASHIQLLYQYSPAFRDAQDRAAYALAMTDPKAFPMVEKTLQNWPEGDHRNQAESYLRRIRQTYQHTGRTAHAALAGRDLPENQTVREAMTEKLERLSDIITQKSNYRSLLLQAREQGGWDMHTRLLLHNAGDTVMHGRMPPADDPTYGRHRAQTKREELARVV